MRFDASSTTIRRRPGSDTRDRRETGRNCVTAPHLPTLADLDRWPEFTSDRPLSILVSSCIMGAACGTDGTSYRRAVRPHDAARLLVERARRSVLPRGLRVRNAEADPRYPRRHWFRRSRRPSARAQLIGRGLDRRHARRCRDNARPRAARTGPSRAPHGHQRRVRFAGDLSRRKVEGRASGGPRSLRRAPHPKWCSRAQPTRLPDTRLHHPHARSESPARSRRPRPPRIRLVHRALPRLIVRAPYLPLCTLGSTGGLPSRMWLRHRRPGRALR